MIDLRSDTLTQPTEKMRAAMVEAEVGDDGRTDADGFGEDPTVRKLEAMASQLTGKEAALFCNSGTMANYVNLMVYCNRGDQVLLSRKSHLFRSEKAPFMEELFGFVPVFYEEDDYGIPDVHSIKQKIDSEDIKVICLENTHNYYGGTCIPVDVIQRISVLANTKGIPIFVDGARIFNAAISLNVTLEELCKPVHSLTFCLSKGLGAPVGSVICGDLEFIKTARGVRKLLGGNMRQSGILAVAGIEALKDYEERLREDHRKTRILVESLKLNQFVTVDKRAVQTNIINMDFSKSRKSAVQVEKDLFKRGLRIKAVGEHVIRLTVYADIHEEQILKAAEILNGYIAECGFE